MMEHTKGMIYIAGIGPGSKEGMTEAAREALENSDLIIGYTTYIELIREYFPDKMFETTPMRREEERCRMVLEEAEKGKNVCLVSSGDAGVYGMAGLVLQMSVEYPALAGRIQIIPGVTAALSGAALLGSPLTNDFCTISLSDLLTPKEEIERRLKGRPWVILRLCFIIRPAAGGGIILRERAIFFCRALCRRAGPAGLSGTSAGKARRRRLYGSASWPAWKWICLQPCLSEIHIPGSSETDW